MIDLWRERCREGVVKELNQRKWTLVSADGEFLQNAAQEVRQRHTELATVSDSEIHRAAVRCYTRVLYDACGKTGTETQQKAFTELWDYLYSHAMYRLHDSNAAQDALQEALIKIFEKRTTCKDSGSFLGWCDQVLLNVIRERFRAHYQHRLTERGIEYESKEISIVELIGEDVEENENRTEDFIEDEVQNTLRDALRGPMRETLLATMRTCLKNERQERVIVELFINDKGFLEVAVELDTSPLNIQVMKSRALQTLRECAEMRQLFKDWLE